MKTQGKKFLALLLTLAMCLSLLPIGAAAAEVLSASAPFVEWDFGKTLTLADDSAWNKSLINVNGIKAATGTGVLTASESSASAQTTSSSTIYLGGMPVGGYWQLSFATTDYTGINIATRQYSTGKGTSSFKILYSLDGFATAGTEITSINYGVGAKLVPPNPYLVTETDNIYPVSIENKSDAMTFVNFTLPTAAEDQSNVTIRFVAQSIADGGSGNSRISNISVTGTPAISDNEVAPVLPSLTDGSIFKTGTTLTLDCATSGAVISYNFDSAAFSSWTPYIDSVALPDSDCTLYVKAEKDTLTTSNAGYTYKFVTPTDIATARAAVSDPPGSGNQTTTTPVCTEGVVTFADGNNVTIQDATAGIAILFTGAPAGVEVGSKLLVSGFWGNTAGWVQIKAPFFSVLGTEALPAPAETTIAGLIANKATLESQRVKIVNAQLGVINTNGSTPLTQGGESLVIYRMPPLGNAIYEGFMVDIIGVLGIFNTPQLRVGGKADVTQNADYTAPIAVGIIKPSKADGSNVTFGEKITFTCPTPGITLTYSTDSADGPWTALPSVGFVVPQDAPSGAYPLFIKGSRDDLDDSVLSLSYMVGERQATPIGEARMAGTGTFKVTGVVTWVNGVSVTIQEPTGALEIILKAANPNVKIGNAVAVTGALALSAGMLQLKADAAGLTITDAGVAALPEPVVISAASLAGTGMKTLESQRVTIRGLKADGIDAASTSTFIAAAGSNVPIFKIPANAVTQDKWYDVTGIVQTRSETVPGQFGGTVTTYTFSIRVPSADCFAPVSEPDIPEQWKVVQFSAADASYKEDPRPTAPADAGESMAGALATLSATGGNFEYSSGGHTSKGWDKAAQYLQFQFSTAGFRDLNFSVSTRSSGTGPRDLKVQYSTNGTDFTDLPGGAFTVLSTSITLTLKNVILPAALDNQASVYLRFVTTSNVSQGGTKDTASGGAFTYAGAAVYGTEIPSDSLVISSVPAGEVPTGTQITLSNKAGAPMQYRVITADTPDLAFAAYTGPFALTALPATVEAYGDSGAAQSRTRSYIYSHAKTAPVKPNFFSGKVLPGTVIKLTCATGGAAITYSITTNVGGVGGAEAVLTNQTYDPAAGILLADDKFPIHIAATAAKAGYLPSTETVLDYTKKVAGAEKLYFGQLHSHNAEYSDGAGHLADALTYAKDKSGTDFVAFTDHSNYFDKKILGDITDATKGDPDPTQTTKTRWQVYNETINAASTDSFIGIPGYEMTWSSGPGHINTFNSVGMVSRNNAVLNNKVDDAGMRAYYKLLAENPQTISQFNHPGSTFGTFADFGYYSAEADAVLTMVEVGNGEGLVGSTNYFPSYQYYDMALSKGWHVAPTNNQDNHGGGWGNANTCRSVVLTDDFSKEGIFQAMRDMRMYSTEDKNLSITYEVNGQSMGTILPEPPATMAFHIVVTDADNEAIGSISIITENGRVLKTVEGITASTYTWDFTLDKVDYAYYYVRVNEADKDIAVTAPVWASEVKKIGVTDFSTTSTAQVKGEAMDLTASFYNYEKTPLTVNSIVYSMTRLGKTTTLATVTGADLTNAGLATIPAGADRRHTLSYTPNTVGLQTVNVTLNVTLGGVSYQLSKNKELEVISPDEMTSIALDAGHGNFYVTGDYPDNDANFIAMAGASGVRTHRLTAPITYDAIKNMRLLVLTVPYRGYSGNEVVSLADSLYAPEELEAIAKYAREGGNILLCSKSDRNEPAEANEKANVISNGILTAIGAKARVLEGIVVDEDPNVHATTGSGELFRLYFKMPASFNTASPFMAGVVANMGKGYSAYNSAPIALNGATALITGPATTWGIHFSEMTNNTTIGPNPTTVSPKGSTAVMATETLSGGGFLIVAGTTFLSNKEIESVSGDDRVQPYVNAQIAANILEACKLPPVITNISVLQDTASTQEGEKFTIVGQATTNASGYDQDTAFFDCIYVQDATGGINVFPVDGSIKAGQTVQITGYVSSYLGERQLQARNVKVLDDTVKPLPDPKLLTTEEAHFGSDRGRLVKVSGVVTSIILKEGSPEAIFVRDASGYDCRVFIDGYITKNVTIANLAVGHAITAIGLSSHDTLGARIRISDRANITCQADEVSIPAGVSTALFGLPEDNFCNWAGAGDGSFMFQGVTIAQPGPDRIVPVGGSLAYKTGFTGFWADRTDMQEGNFLGFRLTMPVAGVSPVILFGGKTVTARDGVTAGGLDYYDFIYRVDKAKAATVAITVDLDGGGDAYTPTTYTVDLAGLTCTAKDAPNIPGGSTSQTVRPGDVKETADGVSVALRTGKVTINAAATEKLIALNAEKPITLSGGGLAITIPAGSLTKNADINAMIVNPKTSGNAIQVTHPDGTTSILPFAVLGEGAAAYIANQAGSYQIIDNTKFFPDLAANHWAADAIGFVSAHALFSGMSDGSFGAEVPMSRSMIVTVLARLDNASGTSGSAFGDVPANAWFADAVSWAAENKLMVGDGGNFNPGAPVTREQLCTILVRYMEYAGITLPEVASAEGFGDTAGVSAWASSAVTTALKTGLITGVPGNLINPQGEANRAEIATILMRFISSVLK